MQNLTKKRYNSRMIHRFWVSNYRSIREQVVLDLRIPGTAPDQPRFRRSTVKPGVRLPTVAVLMGPNGSGKTTLLRALAATARIASYAPPSGENNYLDATPFATQQSLNEPTRFGLEVEADWLDPDDSPQLFRYELAVERGGTDAKGHVFRHEALFHFPRGRPRRLLERGGPGEPVYVSGEVSGMRGLRSRDGSLKPVVGDDVSAIVTLALLNAPLATRITEWLRGIQASSNLMYHERWAFPTSTVVDMFEKNEAVRGWIEKRLPSSDLGIRGVEIREVNVPGDPVRRAAFFVHHGLDAPVPLVYESNGTQRLFHLLPQLRFALAEGRPAVLDEIDGDLHVDIVGEILGWFRSRETNPGNAQLLISSHNVGLLDDLEKEELSILEKTRDGATRVHGAQDVRGLRRDVRLYPKYRAGVLGGIPKIG